MENSRNQYFEAIMGDNISLAQALLGEKKPFWEEYMGLDSPFITAIKGYCTANWALELFVANAPQDVMSAHKHIFLNFGHTKILEDYFGMKVDEGAKNEVLSYCEKLKSLGIWYKISYLECDGEITTCVDALPEIGQVLDGIYDHLSGVFHNGDNLPISLKETSGRPSYVLAYNGAYMYTWRAKNCREVLVYFPSGMYSSKPGGI